MNKFEIFKTDYWTVSHRQDSRYLGYLIVSSIQEVTEISKLCLQSLAELGNILALTEELLQKFYSPYKIIISKFGFSKGYNLHFHILPITSSVLNLITKQKKYNVIDPDGIDAILFICREYCEQPLNSEQEIKILDEISRLKLNLINIKKYE